MASSTASPGFTPMGSSTSVSIILTSWHPPQSLQNGRRRRFLRMETFAILPCTLITFASWV